MTVLKSVKELFGIGPDSIKIPVKKDRHTMVFTPEWGDNYQHRADLLSPVLDWLIEPVGDSMWLSGPTGSGKSSLMLDICHRLNWPSVSVTANRRLTVQALKGRFTVVDGSMFFVHGPLAQAMKHGFVFILNEADLMAEDELAALNDLTEGRPMVIEENGGEVIEPHPDFRFVATANTNGTGDETGQYIGTGRMNLAFMHRFRGVQVGYMEPEVESKLLETKVPGLPETVRQDMIKVANIVRDRFMDDGEGSVETTLSTRVLERWAYLTVRYKDKAKQGISPLRYALDVALLNNTTLETKEAIHEIVNQVFGVETK
jgi:cobaltochelatase CobS